MTNSKYPHESLWIGTTEETNYPTLNKPLNVDVLIIGAGIAGLSAANFLKEKGLSVAIIESNKIVKGVTGFTTAKITSLHLLIYSYLTKFFGKEKAFLYGKANQQGIEIINNLVQKHKIDCDFIKADAYVYSEFDTLLKLIEYEVKIAQGLDLPASFTTSTELPFGISGAIKFTNQAHFHPRKYLLELSKVLEASGCDIYENTRALEIKYGKVCTVITDQKKILAKNVIIATHQPFPLRGFYFARMHQRRSYVVAATLKKKVLEGMYINLGPNIHSFRPQPYGGGQILLSGGEDHIAGQAHDTVEKYKRLEEYTRENFDVESIEYTWSTQDNITLDLLPYIGRLTKNTPNVYVATGFGSWGMTNGTISGQILSDYILGNENPYFDLFNPSRFPSGIATISFIKNNFNVAREFIAGYLPSIFFLKVKNLKNGEGKIIQKGFRKVAVYKDEKGLVHYLSPTCTHLKCIVCWNTAEKSWDCPCHGSRFSKEGKLIHGPATKDLQSLNEEKSK